ncbi:hypothetical protein NUU61_004362 [Penicillium alfredii]|uniref:Uncharacterized protein n=1 Tax=Penicillium alfredii TaxID=1506179 RepID=A0A9W9FLL1_9EURO|nr:uncharacterized protein NUU61_004362 [Penicillium alfredii]KAJ5102140.1 hypothetical protein NUU61_004362 [Penicillium alfredii]
MQLASPWVTVLFRLVLLGVLLGLFHDVAATAINLEHRATATTRYIVSPKNGVDSTGRKIIEVFIKKTINKQKIYSYTNKRRKQFLWWVVECSRDEIKKIKNHKGVKSADESMPLELAYSDEPEPADEDSYFNQTLNESPLMKRDYTPDFVKQLNAVKELRQISIPGVSSRPERWPDYVFERAAGAGAVIFHIEMVNLVPESQC